MTAPHASGKWRKSSYSGQDTNCVEVAIEREVRVRDTKNRSAGLLTVSAAEWVALLDAVKGGQLGT